MSNRRAARDNQRRQDNVRAKGSIDALTGKITPGTNDRTNPAPDKEAADKPRRIRMPVMRGGFPVVGKGAAWRLARFPEYVFFKKGVTPGALTPTYRKLLGKELDCLRRDYKKLHPNR